MSIHPVEKLWRECHLPEYFLGNGGTNTKLYALYGSIIEKCASIAESDKGITECPYTTDKPGDSTWTHNDYDLCPICHQTGKDDGSKCRGLARQRIASAIRALAPPPPLRPQERDPA